VSAESPAVLSTHLIPGLRRRPARPRGERGKPRGRVSTPRPRPAPPTRTMTRWARKPRQPAPPAGPSPGP